MQELSAPLGAHKSCVVLDLDATLVDTFGEAGNWHYVEAEENPRIKKRIFDVNVEGQFMWGAMRPYTKDFLVTCFDTFDIVGVWSAGIAPYVHEVVKEIFPFEPHFVWTRDQCKSFIDYEHLQPVKQKPLAHIFKEFPQIDPKRTIIIDDYRDVCNQDTLYHVHIPAWKGSFKSLTTLDNRLMQLARWIKSDLNVSDPNHDFKFTSHKSIFQ